MDWDFGPLNEELYYVLVEKTEGEAAHRVGLTDTGAGLLAYQRLYLWFAGTSGLALSERVRLLMNPEPIKRDEDLDEALERWFEQNRLIAMHGSEYKLAALFKITALRIMMSKRRELFDQMESVVTQKQETWDGRF